ncbi:MAG: hypothetical protein ACREOH_19070, partial [Candidatus Entotheonellia bacterium]
MVPAQRADDPVDVPAIARVWECLKRGGPLYVGDGQMGTLEARASIQVGGDDYLCVLSEIRLPLSVLAGQLAPMWRGEQAVGGPPHIAGSSPERMAEGFEQLSLRETVLAYPWVCDRQAMGRLNGWPVGLTREVLS